MLLFLIFAAQWRLAIQPRSPSGPVLVNIHCDCQRHKKDRGAVFVADHPLSLQTQDREPPQPHHVERDRGKKCGFPAESMWTKRTPRDQRWWLRYHTATESGGSTAGSQRTDSLSLNEILICEDICFICFTCKKEGISQNPNISIFAPIRMIPD